MGAFEIAFDVCDVCVVGCEIDVSLDCVHVETLDTDTVHAGAKPEAALPSGKVRTVLVEGTILGRVPDEAAGRTTSLLIILTGIDDAVGINIHQIRFQLNIIN